MQVIKIAGTVLACAAVAVFFFCTVGLFVIAHKATNAMKSVGAEPPEYFGHVFLWGPVPEFWEYLRDQSRRTGEERLKRLARVAEVLLVGRLVCFVGLLVFIVAQMFVG